jgi:beta-glucanase (GH16 family)
MKFKISAFLCLAAFSVSAQKKDTLFYESFNGNALNRKVWNVEVTGHTVNNEQQAYVDSAIVLKQNGGSLFITPVSHPGYTSKEQKSYDFLSGRINTRGKFEFIHGAASARIKMSGGAGLWPAFWLLGEGKWPDCGEIDIMETVGDSSWFSNALHGPGYSGNTPLSYRYFFEKGVDVTQWHIYTVEWTSDHITFIVDDKPIYNVTRAMVEKYGHWAYDNPKFIILNFALGGGYPQGVNKLNAPYPGLSQSSVDKIKTGSAQMQVDWVMVTR